MWDKLKKGYSLFPFHLRSFKLTIDLTKMRINCMNLDQPNLDIVLMRNNDKEQEKNHLQTR